MGKQFCGDHPKKKKEVFECDFVVDEVDVGDLLTMEWIQDRRQKILHKTGWILLTTTRSK